MGYIFFGLLLIIIGGVISIIVGLSRLFPEGKGMSGYILLIFFIIGAPFILISSLYVLITGDIFTASYDIGQPMNQVYFELDALSAFFASLIIMISTFVLIYSQGYIKPDRNKTLFIGNHYFFFSLLVVSMVSIVIVRNSLAFLILWEIMSMSSFFLVQFDHSDHGVRGAAINYIISMHIGLIMLIIAFVLTDLKAGSRNFGDYRNVLGIEGFETSIIFILFFIGFAFKAGFIPFHTWLPKAHPEAPSNISSIMSGVMIKTGVYGILRILTYLAHPQVWTGYFVLIISLITGIFGIINALAQRDIKRLLAFSSIENIGIIGIGIGVGMLGLSYNKPVMAAAGFTGALLHTINHSIFKTLLFFGAGTVYNLLHTKSIDTLGGLIKKVPITAVGFLIGALSITGLPPFNGFISKFLIYFGLLSEFKGSPNILLAAKIFSFAALALLGGLTFACFTNVFGIAFLGTYRGKNKRMNEIGAAEIFKTSLWMDIPCIALALGCVIIGLFPQIIITLIQAPVKSFNIDYPAGYIDMASSISQISLIFVLMVLILLSIRYLLLKTKIVQYAGTWGCGYSAPSPLMQYTSSSFAQPITRIARKLIGMEEDIKGADKLFEDSLHYKSNSMDIIDKDIVKRILNALNTFLNRFTWIQNGHLRYYILMILVTLLVVLLLSILNTSLPLGIGGSLTLWR